ncbi:MAG: hypothetical protein HQK76_04025 [Desulfobacterales bacterium]|nr:hypothetical protein [Desulfobacterales bacterium]
MRAIKIANEKKRDATVSFEPKNKESKVLYVLPDNSSPKTVKILKTTLEYDIPSLTKKYDNLENIAQEIISHDPEIDIEKFGMLIDDTRKLYVSKDNQILYGVDLYEIVKNPDGSEKERHLYTKTRGNINAESPIMWSGKYFSKSEAIRMFVFSKKYQIRHVNGLTYDFLYDMAKKLHENKQLMLIGSGKKGIQPLIFHDGGIPYRAFLEGRINGEKYCLILHLTNLELKEIKQDKEVST